jgi:hypothetical protein
MTATITKIFNANTVAISMDNVEYTVQLFGIQGPVFYGPNDSRNQCYANESVLWTYKYLYGRQVYVYVIQNIKGGRSHVVLYYTNDSKFSINEYSVFNGITHYYIPDKGYIKNVSTSYLLSLETFYKAAQVDKNGLWSCKDTRLPFDYLNVQIQKKDKNASQSWNKKD